MQSMSARRALIERLEREAVAHPARYRAKVAALAAAGFGVLGAALLLALGVSVGLVLLLLAASPVLLLKLAKLVWIPIAFGWVLLRSLWVKVEPPQGYRLASDEAPMLHAEVERLRAATSAPRLEGILITGEFNAAAATVPRALGLLGHRHYLVLGLPLMQALDPAQFASVIAHEFGHFGGGHGRFGGWIYRLRMSWARLLAELRARRSWASGAFVRFFDWYAPYFNAYSFVLARAQEYQADATAARVCGAEATGEALIRVHLGAECLQRDFWPGLQRLGQQQSLPPRALYRDMAMQLRQPGEDEAQRLQRVLDEAAGHEDTHPGLGQRLFALGVPAAPVAPPRRSFAEACLGPLLPRLERDFSEQWYHQVERGWREDHQRLGDEARRLSELDALPALDGAQALEYAGLLERLRPGVDVRPLYRQALQAQPMDPLAHFRMGELLLADGNPAGEAHLRRAIALDPACRAEALRILERHYRASGDTAGLDAVHDEWAQMVSAQARAADARGELGSGDAYLPHGLDGAVLAALRRTLDELGTVSQAWLVRKQLPGDDAGVPHFVVLVAWKGWLYREDRRLRQLVDVLALPGSVVAFSAGRRRAIARRVRRRAGAAVYRRDKR